MKNGKPGIKDKLRYQFDNLMAKGTIALVIMLFLITAVVVLITGIISALLVSGNSVGSSIWMSLMHAIDTGNLAGDDVNNIWYVLVMSIVTICGIFVTSILIGIISTGFEQKLNELRKGTSKVLESSHTVIIGFNESIYTILTELIEAGSNKKRNCIIVLGEEEKELMEELIKGHIEDFKSTRIICKSGKLTESYLLERASLESARSVIINQNDDFAVIKIILASVNYLKSKDAFYNNDMHITSMIYNRENLEAAKIAGEGKAEILFFKDAISRIIAHTCREPGLSIVLTDFFDFGGDEFYFEEFPQLTGEKFGDILNLFEKSVVVGISSKGKVMLNPPMNTVVEAGDKIIHLAEDDDFSKPSSEIVTADISAAATEKYHENEKTDLLILGHNHFLEDIINEIDNYAKKDSVITIAGNETEKIITAEKFKNIKVEIIETNIYSRSNLEEIINSETKDILLLSDLTCDNDEADSKTLLLLIHLRDIANKSGRTFNITSEMCTVSNQKLAKVTNVNDFVVGSTITNLIIAQVSENRELADLFEDLLDEEGSELYMKKAISYVKEDVQTDFYALTQIAKNRGEIVIGYKKSIDGEILIVTNPEKLKKVSFSADDYLIVIAENDD